MGKTTKTGGARQDGLSCQKPPDQDGPAVFRQGWASYLPVARSRRLPDDASPNSTALNAGEVAGLGPDPRPSAPASAHLDLQPGGKKKKKKKKGSHAKLAPSRLPRAPPAFHDSVLVSPAIFRTSGKAHPIQSGLSAGKIEEETEIPVAPSAPLIAWDGRYRRGMLPPSSIEHCESGRNAPGFRRTALQFGSPPPNAQ